MATNRTKARGRQLYLTPTDGAATAGAPGLVGQLPCVALVTVDASGNASLDTLGVYSLSVKGIDQSGSSAVAVGDLIYYVTGDTPKLSKKNTGVRFGVALGTVGSAATATIDVRLGY